jgi:malate dehydrogenase (oxaloacetate-decarboxylating)
MGRKEMKISKRGADVLNCSLLNKGTGFTQEERDALGLNGLLPPIVSAIEQQIQRCYQNFSQKRTPLEKYENLVGLLSRNENLFYQFIRRYPAEVMPIIYTPTVGDAAIHYSRIYFHQRGLYLSYSFKNRLDECFSNYPNKEIDVIVVTDGERVLGLGDLGIGGMTIPVGKLSLYTLFGGIHPARTLPIVLDVGTNNPELLKDDLYLGLRHERIRGKEYDDFVQAFIHSLKNYYPNALLQWEDFGRENARRLLEKYRGEVLSFNDDIQGTAAVTVAALMSANRIASQTFSEGRVVILGGGSAGTGIADMIVQAMMAEGLSHKEACQRIYMIDVDGLIHFGSKQVTDAQRPYMQPQSNLKDWKTGLSNIALLDVIVNAKPSMIVGVCGQGGMITKEIVEEMARTSKRPIIFPLSNPTTKTECTPDEVFEWTRGRGIVATGSPFPPVIYEGKTHFISQCNNVYIFPGLGLGSIAVKASKVTDGMIIAAMRTLSGLSPALNDPNGSLFPKIEEVREASLKIALAVAKKACEEGVSVHKESECEKLIAERFWDPHYPTFTTEKK